MEDELENLLIELKSDKPLPRAKAFDRFQLLLDTQLNEVQKFIEGSNARCWEDYFRAAYQGLVYQADKLFKAESAVEEHRKDIRSYSILITKIAESPSCESKSVSYSTIVQNAIEVFSNQGLIKYFGKTFMLLLQKTFLNKKRNPTDVNTSTWSDLLKRLLSLLKSTRHNLSFNELSICAYETVKLGCFFSHLPSELLSLKVFTYLEAILQKRADEKERFEIIAVIYQCFINMLGEERDEICKFIDTIGDHLLSFMRKKQTDLTDKLKIIRMKLIDLMLVAHCPNLGKKDQEAIEFIPNRQNWNRLMLECDYMITNELSTSFKYRVESFDINPITAQCAARFCYYFYFNDQQEISDDEPSTSKRTKVLKKVELMIDRIKPADTVINWNWFVVFSELSYNYKNAIAIEDVPVVLKMLSESLSLINFKNENNRQLYAFAKMCLVLIHHEKLITNPLVINVCKDFWAKIGDGILRVCAGNEKSASEAHVILQLLIRHEKCISSNFVESVLKMYSTNTINRNDKTLTTLITILKTFNLDSLPNGKDLTEKILNYTHQKQTVAQLKRVVTSSEKPTNAVISELSACCCILKTDVINFVKKNHTTNDEMTFEKTWDLKLQTDYIDKMDKALKIIRKKTLKDLLLEDEDFLKYEDQMLVNETVPTELKCIIDLQHFELLMKLSEPRTRVIDVNNTVGEIRDYLRDVLENNDLMMHLATSLLRYHALNEEKLNSSFIAKKIVFQLQEIERLFTLVLEKPCVFDLSETYSILRSLKTMFDVQYHSSITERIRSGSLKCCLNWISKQIDYEVEDIEDREQPISHEAFVNAKTHEKIRYLAITTLCQYFYHEGKNSTNVIGYLDKVDFYMEENMDLHAILNVIDIFAQQSEVPTEAVHWLWNKGIINICKVHKNRLYIMGQLCDRLDKIVKISQRFPDETSSVCVLFRAFAALCSNDENPKYNREVSATFLSKFPYFHKHYFQLYYDESSVQFMYTVVSSKFLKSKSFEIKMAAAKCFSAIMKFDIDAEIDDGVVEIITACRNKIFKHFESQILINSDDTEDDDSSFRIQLYTALFCANFHLQKPMILNISKTFYIHKLSDKIALRCFQKVLKFLKCEATHLMDNNNLPHLLSKWITSKYGIVKFPWYYTDCSTYEAFIIKYYDTVFFALLKQDFELAKELVASASNHPDEYNIKDAIHSTITDTFAFTIPMRAGCQEIKYEAKAKELSDKIDSVIRKDEQMKMMTSQLPEVIIKILVKVIDAEKFHEISGLILDFYPHEESMKVTDFEMCIEYLKKKCCSSSQSLMTYLCNEQTNNVQQLFMLQRSRIQSTELREHKILYLLQYCILVEQTFEYMKDETVESAVSIKEFLMHEFINYFAFLVSDKKYGTKLREIAANFFHTLVNKVVPSCFQEFKPQMSRVMPNLVSIVQENENATIKSKCLNIINFLTLLPALSEEVSIIDRFPIEFQELRTYQWNIKYADREFNLSEEIEHFLLLKNRRVEGLKELSEHLANKKAELKSLFENTQNDLLCRLLQALIEYIQQPADDGRAVEAIKCLGEIGSHHLSKIVFKADDPVIYHPIESVQHCIKSICSKVLDKMESLLLHSDPKIFEASSLACYHMFSSLSSDDYKDTPYLRPFKNSSVKEDVHLFYTNPKVDKLQYLDIKKFFEDNKTAPYEKWLRSLCIMMMTFAGDKDLSSIPDFPLSLAEMLNSQIFQLLVQYNREEINVELLNGLNYFFTQCDETLNYKEKTNEGSIFIDKKAIREMLKLVEVIRMFIENNPRSNMAQILNLNYLHIAKSAKHCEAFFTAIMYCEIWAQREIDNDSEKTFKVSIKNKTLQDVMYDSYLAIGIKDTLDIYLNPFVNRTAQLKNTGQYFQLLLETKRGNADLNEICYDIGLYHLMDKFSNLTKDQDKSKKYDCLWRMSEWDVVVETEQELKDDNGLVDLRGEFNKYHYLGLQCLKNGDELGSNGAVDKARKIILQMLSQQSLECTKTVYKFLEMSHFLGQIEDFGEIRFKRVQNGHENLLKKWNTHDQLPLDYEQYGTILKQRCSIFDTANIKSGRRTWIPAANKSNLLFTIKQSTIAAQPNDAYAIIAKMKQETMELSDQMELLIEESKLYFKTDVTYAKKCLLKVIEERGIERDYITKSTAHRLYGEILAENSAASISEINKNHFEKAQNYLIKYAQYHQKSHLVPNLDNEQQLSQFTQSLSQELDDDIDCKIKSSTCIFDTMAKYFDRMYVSKCAYMNSIEYQSKQKIYARNKETLASMNADKRINKADKEVQKSYTMLLRSCNVDNEEFKNTEKEKKMAAKNALYYYIRSTMNSADNDILNIFRIISLMLENYQSSSFFQDLLNTSLLKVPSFKFIVALPQLTVRLTNDDDDQLTLLLRKLLEHCAIEHPHHTLPLILALKNSHADAEKKVDPEPRVIGAEQLWTIIKRKNKKLVPIMDQLETMSKALINLAYLPCENGKIPSNHALIQMKNLSHLQCPTVELPIRKSGNYPTNDLVLVVKWDKTVTSVGGINAPKKIEVHCSDGIKRSQLLKGKDDMRQDAIMQQIFGVVNQLLSLNKEMAMKQAKVRTYRVVPFSCRSGILEWCSDTMPIGMYLVGNRQQTGAHVRYRPNDMKPEAALRLLIENDQKDSETKISIFQDICQRLKPVFHNFFYEHYKSPGMIFEKKFAYTVSVAVSSMIGYILGIGDRHVQNILIDMQTAEVIHIDFGIAFEAGKCLPHPELIPFRLTRDMVAPMGVSGVDGLFRKTSEETIKILRDHEKTLSTILEVLLYDPMYTWSIGAKHARARQLNDSQEHGDSPADENHDSMASRALQRVQAKLKGYADNTSTCYPSIDGQIQYLIQEATDVGNLSKLFRGWQAYL